MSDWIFSNIHGSEDLGVVFNYTSVAPMYVVARSDYFHIHLHCFVIQCARQSRAQARPF